MFHVERTGWIPDLQWLIGLSVGTGPMDAAKVDPGWIAC